MKTRCYRFPTVLSHVVEEGRKTLCTIGNFDGLHLGHQSLLTELVSRANEEGMKSVLLSFYPHPLSVLRPDVKPPKLSGLETRLRVLSELGVDYLYLVRFTKALSHYSPADFFMRILEEKLSAGGLHVGADLFIGKGRAGDTAVLRKLSEERGWNFGVATLKENEQGEKIGSKLIRDLLSEGEVRKANELLGREFELSGRVVHGEKRGRQIGFPTANIHIPYDFPLAFGVYAALAEVEGTTLTSVVNVGVRPTFGAERISVEAHFLESEREDFYGARVHLRFVQFIRAERKFDSVALLKEQIERDCEEAGALLR